MSDRTRFSFRRASVTAKIRYADVEGLRLNAFVTYSRGYDGEIREVFVTAGKPGSPSEAALRDAGLLISLLLQHGMTIAGIQAAITRGAENRPASQVGVIVDTLAAEAAP